MPSGPVRQHFADTSSSLVRSTYRRHERPTNVGVWTRDPRLTRSSLAGVNSRHQHGRSVTNWSVRGVNVLASECLCAERVPYEWPVASSAVCWRCVYTAHCGDWRKPTLSKESECLPSSRSVSRSAPTAVTRRPRSVTPT